MVHGELLPEVAELGLLARVLGEQVRDGLLGAGRREDVLLVEEQALAQVGGLGAGLGLRGVVVTTISNNGLAAGKLQAGDLIIAVQNARISGASEFFLHLAASAAVQETAIHLMRDGHPLRVTIPAIPRRE